MVDLREAALLLVLAGVGMTAWAAWTIFTADLPDEFLFHVEGYILLVVSAVLLSAGAIVYALEQMHAGQQENP